jgi:L-ascorbate metabolism protein UlaG (beta-lactamase superfamily)
MIPVGGHYTIDALQAKKIIDEIKPALTILMHFRKGKIGYDVIADLDTVLQSFKETEVLPQGSICFDEADIPHKVITLEPIQ